MDNTAFKVLKLRSGDDIIAQLIKNTKEFIRLERPMVIKVMHYVEPMSAMKRETIILYDWMKTTTSNNIDMPRDHILGIYDANPDIIDAYDMQKRLEDNPSLINKINPQRNPGPGFNIDRIMKIVEAKMNMLQEEDEIEEELEFGAGIDFEDIKDMLNDARRKGGKKNIEIVEDKDKNHPDYGTRYTDWSPNIDDYLT
jgi:hypothetical protein|tara:strand:- start:484 stop:1077 length:594 start_codon:yes stop_codon:yes gene_type:complete